MLAVVVRTGEALAVAAVAALAAGAVGWWWLRRKARRLLAARAQRLIAWMGRPQWAGLVPDHPLAVAGWRRRAVLVVWRLARAWAQGQVWPALRGRGRDSGVVAGR